jgi:hypothetical protein
MAPLKLAEHIQRDLEALRDATESAAEANTKKWQAAIGEESMARTSAVENVTKTTESLVAAEATSRSAVEQQVMEAAATLQALQVHVVWMADYSV